MSTAKYIKTRGANKKKKPIIMIYRTIIKMKETVQIVKNEIMNQTFIKLQKYRFFFIILNNF